MYDPNTNSYSSMYEKLNTNGPKEFMAYENFPVPDRNGSRQSFISRQDVLAYIKDFAEPIKNFIYTNQRVIKISRTNSIWHVEIQSTKNLTTTTHSFDILFVCAGQCSKPYLPKFVEKYTKNWIHARDYRKAECYTDKVVAIVGAGLTGVDICPQIAKFARKIYLLHRKADQKKFVFPSNVILVNDLIDVDSERLFLSDGLELDGIDEVIYCTGYRYDFPFFDESILTMLEGGKIVSPLFEHVVHRDFLDSLFFIEVQWTGTPKPLLLTLKKYALSILGFVWSTEQSKKTIFCLGIPLYSIFALLEEYQIKFALSVIEKRSNLPSKNEINKWEDTRFQEVKSKNLNPKFFHVFNEKHEQWDYYKKLADYANVSYNVPNVIVKIDMKNREFFDSRICTFKRIRYEILNDEEFTWEDTEIDDYD